MMALDAGRLRSLLLSRPCEAAPLSLSSAGPVSDAQQHVYVDVVESIGKFGLNWKLHIVTVMSDRLFTLVILLVSLFSILFPATRFPHHAHRSALHVPLLMAGEPR